MRGHVTLCYMVVVGNLNSPLNLFSFAKALMEQGFPSDPFLAKDRVRGGTPAGMILSNTAWTSGA